MTCSIVLKNFQSTYYPGNTISGHLVCTFSSREKVREMRVKLCGKEHTDWVESEYNYNRHGKKNNYGNVQYSGDNAFLNMKLTLLREKFLAPGRYEYPFTFTLPRSLPTNFQGSHGYIKYSIKGIVDLTSIAFGYGDEKYFNLHAPVNFNDIRSELQMEPCSYQEEKIIRCCYCSTGPILLDVHLQKEAFVLGEVAKIKMDTTNLSNKHIQGINAKLKMIIESKATNPRNSYKFDTELLATKSDTEVGARGQRTYELDLEIPSSAKIFSLIGSTLFKNWFVLKVEAVIQGCNSNMNVESGVVIGHIPLEDGRQSQAHEVHVSSSAIPEVPFTSPTRIQRLRPNNQHPHYTNADKKPPYPVRSCQFPLPSSTPRQIGFSLPPSLDVPQIPILSSVGMPPVPVHGAPYPPGPGFSAAATNAPLEMYVPSASTKEEMANKGKLDMIDAEGRSCGSSELPPSYTEAVSAPFEPGIEDVFIPGSANHNNLFASTPMNN